MSSEDTRSALAARAPRRLHRQRDAWTLLWPPARRALGRDAGLLGEPPTGPAQEERLITQPRDRVPPGQTVTAKWPVLTYGSTPRVDTARWTFKIFGEVAEERRWTWEEFTRLPRVEVVSDVHCVTRWSRFDNRWEGVRPRDLLAPARPRPEARHVLVHADPDYTTNLPLAALLEDDVVLAITHDGQPLPRDHGGPVRLVVPRLYFWKSAKWVWGFELMEEDQAGFWEAYGYHMRGDPWLEERFGGRVQQTMQSARAKKAREGS